MGRRMRVYLAVLSAVMLIATAASGAAAGPLSTPDQPAAPPAQVAQAGQTPSTPVATAAACEDATQPSDTPYGFASGLPQGPATGVAPSASPAAGCTPNAAYQSIVDKIADATYARIHAGKELTRSQTTRLAATAAPAPRAAGWAPPKTLAHHQPTAAAPYINGTVTDGSAAAIDSMYVEVETTDGYYYDSAYTDGTGHYAIQIPDPDDYILFLGTAAYGHGWFTGATLSIQVADAHAYSVSTSDVTVDVTWPAVSTISGTVTDTSASPVPLGGISVEFRSETWDWYDQVETQSNGTYSMVVIPGDYLVNFYDYDGVYVGGWYSTTGLVMSSDDATTVHVSTSPVTADIQLPKANHITGTVTGGASPLEGVQVRASSSSGYPSGLAITDASGAYDMSVAPGSYFLDFYDEASTWASGYYSSTSGFTYWLDDATLVNATTGDVEINVTLPAAITIGGKVTRSGGVGLYNIDVFADGVKGGFWSYTGPDGTFKVSVPPGTYLLRFEDVSGTYAGGYYSTSGFQYDSSAASLVVVGSSSVTGKNITLPLPLLIKGKVTRAGGVGLNNVRVEAQTTDHRGYVGETLTEPDGTYEVAVSPGTYTLYFEGHGYGAGYYGASGFVYFEDNATTVTVTSANVTGKSVTLPPAIYATGVATDGGGEPIGDIYVYATSSNEEYTAETYTDVDGSYSLSLAPGYYTLSFVDDIGNVYGSGYYQASAAGHFTYYPSSAGSVTVGSAGVSGLNISLPDAIVVAGRLTKSGGGGVGGLDVAALTLDGRYWNSTTTEADGSYSIAVSPGNYRLYEDDPSSVYAAGYYSDSGFTYSSAGATTVTVTTSDVTGKDMELPPALHIEGTVTIAGGGRANAGVELYVDGRYETYGWTDADGSYSISAAPGDYTLYFSDRSQAHLGGYYSSGGSGHPAFDASLASKVSVTSTDVTGIDVTLPVGVHIKGKISRSGGAGAYGVYVEAFTDSSSSYAYTAVDGTYSVAVPAGTYKLWFSSDGRYGDGYYSTSGFTYSAASASSVVVASTDVTGKSVTLPNALHIKGKVTKTPGARPAATVGSTPQGDYSPINVQAVPVAGSGGYAYGQTYSDGTYSLTVAPGTYTVFFRDYARVYAFGYWSSAGFTRYAASAGQVTVTTADATGKNVTLSKATSIKGKLVNASGVGLAGVVVIATGADGSGYSIVSGWDGSYSIDVIPGTYTVQAWDQNRVYASCFYGSTPCAAYKKDAVAVVVASGTVTGKNMTLPLGLHIKGTVTNAAHSPLANILVITSEVGGLYVWGASTDTSGNYSIVVPPGNYTVWFSDHDGANGRGYYSDSGFVYSDEDADPVSITTADATADVTMTPAGYLVFPASTYHAISPRRVLDTRPTGSGHTNAGLVGQFTAGTVRTFQVAYASYVGGTDYAIPSNASAVTGNVTIVGQTANGLVALGPTMTPTGAPTTINFAKGDVRANNVTIGLAPDGSLSAVYRSATAGAKMDLIFDITGYFLPDAMGATYHTVTPGRVLDTRPTGGGSTNIGLKGKFANKAVRTFSVAGVVPVGGTTALVPSNATAVSGNLTVTKATSPGFVAVGPTMTSSPSTSTINTVAGSNRANGVIVALNGGKLQAVWAGATGSSADVIFDVTGYFTNDVTGMSYHPVEPIRVFSESAGHLQNRLPVTTGIIAGHVSPSAAGISGNLTVVDPSSAGFAFISPETVASPTSSTVNLTAHQTVANGVNLAAASGNVALIWCGTVGSQTYLQLDVTGYWK